MGFLEEVRGHKREVSMLIERRMELLNKAWAREQTIKARQYHKHDWEKEFEESKELLSIKDRLDILGIVNRTDLSHQQL